MTINEYVIKSPFSKPNIIDLIAGLFRPKSDHNPYTKFTKEGITIENPASRTSISFPFTSCKSIFATAFLYTTNSDYTAMYVAFFVELTEGTEIPKLDILSETIHGDIPFAFTPEKFATNIGITDKFGFYINAAEAPGESPDKLLKGTNINWGRIRPFLPVKDTREYNNFIKEYVGDETILKEYLLTETA